MLGVSTKKTLSQTGQTHEGVFRKLNAAGQIDGETDQAGNTTMYEYTADGLVAAVHDNTSKVVTRNTYDPVTRLLKMRETVTADGEVQKKAFEYDRTSGKMIAVFDPFDRENTKITYTYDAYGNTISTRYPDGKTVSHEFDEGGKKKISTTDVAGNVTHYNYDRFGVLVSVKQGSSDGQALGEVSYSYDSLGRVTKISRDNEMTTSFTFTSADEIATETTTAADGHVIADVSYTYDSNGNLIQRVDRDVRATQPVTTATYAYDAFDRLRESRVYAGEAPVGEPHKRTQYEMSVSGDVTKETVVENGTTKVREFEYNSLGYLTAVTTDGLRIEQKYDSAGNLVSDIHGTQYNYNSSNQLVRKTLPDGTQVTTTYWASDQQRTITSHKADEGATAAETAYWDDATRINDIYANADATATTTASYLLGLSRHTRTLTSEGSAHTQYYVSDRHGSTTHLVDAHGTVVTSYEYTDYGVPTIQTTDTGAGAPDTGAQRNPFQYAGEYTTDTGAQLLAARTYDPETMRFTTENTLPFFNSYLYANADPLTMLDPTGRTATDDTFTKPTQVPHFTQKLTTAESVAAQSAFDIGGPAKNHNDVDTQNILLFGGW